MITLYEAMTATTSAESFAKLLRELTLSRNMAQARIDEIQGERTVILHEFERPRCLYDDRAKLATQLQKLLAERRKLKDWLCANKQIFNYIDSNRGLNLQKELDGFVGAARKAVKEAETRKRLEDE